MLKALRNPLQRWTDRFLHPFIMSLHPSLRQNERHEENLSVNITREILQKSKRNSYEFNRFYKLTSHGRINFFVKNRAGTPKRPGSASIRPTGQSALEPLPYCSIRRFDEFCLT